MKVSVNGKFVDLLDGHYKAEGGQAKVYVRDGTAYKIFHNPSDMIAPAKIRELSQIKRPNILAPQNVVCDKNGREVGFTMPSADNFEFLCKLFSKGFRNRNRLTPQTMIDLIKEMQLTLQYIHSLGFLVVDFNEMNFLVDNKGWKIPYFIDVDSYKTPSFPASALMESVRDRKASSFPNGKLKYDPTELSDWFSFAVVAFRTYIGAHPYGGQHPNFGGEGSMGDRMDKNVSIFDSAVQLPGAVQDFSVIPPSHMDWFKRVFIHGERSVPPLPDGVAVVPMAVAKIIAGNERFTAVQEAMFKSEILQVAVIAGSRYYLTDAGVYQEQSEVLPFTTRDKVRGIVPVQGDTFVVGEVNKHDGTVVFCDKHKERVGETAGESFTVANGCIYTICKHNLIENSFINAGRKVVHAAQIVGQVFAPNAKLFNGVVMQDMLGKAFAVIPRAKGSVESMALPELNGMRIVDAKYERNFLVVMAEKGGEYSRFVFVFQSKMPYTVRFEKKVDTDTISFTVLDNGLCIMTVNDKKVEAFFNNAKVKEIARPPFDSEDTLYSEGNSAFVIKGEKLYKISLK